MKVLGIPYLFLLFVSFEVFVEVESVLVKTPPWPHPYWDIPGDYCRSHYPIGECCPGRQDRCSVPILGTLCYCDTFCNRTDNSDCCPDYFSHCEGLSGYDPNFHELSRPGTLTVPGPPTDCKYGLTNISDPMCEYKGQRFSDRETIKDNCNVCKCQVSVTKPGCMDVLCTREQCLVEPDVIDELENGYRGGLYTWVGANYSEFWGRTLEDGTKGRLGGLRPDYPVSHMTAIHFTYNSDDLPTFFNAKDKWADNVTAVRDQGWCSASWAVSTAAVASDRISIDYGHPVELSVQGLLSCDRRGQAGCQGGHTDQAWNYMRRKGLWEEFCQPYTSAEGDLESCPSTYCHSFRTQPAYRVGRENTIYQIRRKEEDIMYEIMTQGPVQALMQVYTDFFMYKSGVYYKTNLARSEVAGYHAVRLVGWGEERGVRYWTVANSWGHQWGEDGYFRIRRGTGECQIEDFVVGVWPMRDRRRPRLRSRQRDTSRLFSERTMNRRRGNHRSQQNRIRNYHQVG